MIHQTSVSLQQQGENSLETLHSQLELVVNSVMEELNQITSNSNMMVALKKILSSTQNNSYSDAIYIRSIETFLTGAVEAHDYISSIYLYFDGYDVYFSSSSKQKSISEADQNWLEVYLNMSSESSGQVRLRIQSESQYSEDSDTIVLSVYRRMLIQDGVIVLNLNLRKLQESLNNISGDSSELLYLFDETGSLLTIDKEGLFNKEELENINSYLMASIGSAEKGIWQKIDNKSYLMHTKSYDLYNIYLVSLIPRPILFGQLAPLLGLFFVFFLLDLCIAIWVSYVTTKRNFREIEYTLTLFAQAEKGIFPSAEESNPKDEYDVILNNILRMFLNTTYLNTQLAEKQYRQQVMEMSTLQYQINPHFLFNTLQTVSLEVQKLNGDTMTVIEILNSLSGILKYSLGNPTETVTLKEELIHLKEYVSIQQYRLSEEFIVYYEIDDEWMDFHVPRLLLQPLLENSILHGFRESERKGYVKVKAYPRNGWMLFAVIDNGVGIAKEELITLRKRICDENSNNIGLTNVNRRLSLYYGSDSALKIQSKKGWGCCISFRIPFDSGTGLDDNTNNDKK